MDQVSMMMKLKIGLVASANVSRCVPLLYFSLCSVACLSTTVPDPSFAKPVRAICGSPGEDEFFFPVGWINDTNPLLDDTARDEFNHVLEGMHAPSLSCGIDTVQESYRLLWLPSYRPNVVISVGRSGDVWTADIAEFEHPRFRHPWRVVRHSTHPVSSDKADQLLVKLSLAGFWTTPGYVNSLVSDGVIWVIEGRRGNGYRVVTRLNPKNEAFQAAGNAFFSVAEVGIPPENSSETTGAR